MNRSWELPESVDYDQYIDKQLNVATQYPSGMFHHADFQSSHPEYPMSGHMVWQPYVPHMYLFHNFRAPQQHVPHVLPVTKRKVSVVKLVHKDVHNVDP